VRPDLRSRFRQAQRQRHRTFRGGFSGFGASVYKPTHARFSERFSTSPALRHQKISVIPVIDPEAIFSNIKRQKERIRALGASEERERIYYAHLSGPDEYRDEYKDLQALEVAVAGLDLSEDDVALIKEVLESGRWR
jgi:hypothetical protein